jgi:hypothetical protein
LEACDLTPPLRAAGLLIVSMRFAFVFVAPDGFVDEELVFRVIVVVADTASLEVGESAFPPEVDGVGYTPFVGSSLSVSAFRLFYFGG